MTFSPRRLLCLSTRVQPPHSLPPPPLHDVTPSLEVQWRYWTKTAIAFWGPRLDYVANVEGKTSTNAFTIGPVRERRPADTRKGDLMHELRAR
ncbi:uncharacterized protein V6R79_019208 [Siganus canaliculatus]